MAPHRHSVAIGRAFFWAGIASILAVVLALVLQHGFGMKPCPWCTVQRLLYIVTGVLLLVASRLLMVPQPRRGASVGLAVFALLCSGAGLAAALHQQFVAAAQDSCDLTLADRILMTLRLDSAMPWLFRANASCADANLPLFGVPFALWSATAFTFLLIVCLLGSMRLMRRR